MSITIKANKTKRTGIDLADKVCVVNTFLICKTNGKEHELVSLLKELTIVHGTFYRLKKKKLKRKP